MDEVLWVLNNKRQWYEKLMEQFAEELDSCPKGSLVEKKIGGKSYYYHQCYEKSGERSQIYIPREQEQALVPGLLRKRHVAESMKVLEQDVAAIKHFTKRYKGLDCVGTSKGLGFAPSHDFASGIGRELLASQRACDWANEAYQSNPYHQEQLIHVTIGGRKMRSKSEVLIGNLLEQEGIPYRYESALLLEGKVYFPDFLILQPWNNRLKYWEHCGMMGDEQYRKHAEEKLEVYQRNGIVPWDNLIVTYDQEDGGINTWDIGWMIRGWKN